MKVNELVTELDHLGVRLWAENGQLRFRAPKGVLTDERRAQLVDRKLELLDYLERDSGTLVTEPGARHEPFPLTDVQSAYLLGRHSAFAYGGIACTGYLEVSFPDIPAERVGDAWRKLVGRHDMLRAVMDADGYQRVLATVPDYQIATTDLRGAAAGTVEAHLHATRAELTGGLGDAARWPLFGLRLTELDSGLLLHLSIELLVVDSASLRLLLSELDTLVREPDAELPELEITFRDYVLTERRLRQGPRYHRDREYWLNRIDELPTAPQLPTVDSEPDGPVRFRRLSAQLPAETWTALRQAAERHGVTASSVVLAAYAEVIGRWSKHRSFTLNLPLFNRLPLHEQIGSVVGDFTSVNLLAVDLDGQQTFVERVRAISGQLFEDLDHRLFTGVEVLGELARRRGHRVLMPVVFTSTLGAAEQAEPFGTIVHGLTQTPQVWIDCQATEHADGVLLAWDVREGVFPAGLTDDAFAAFTELVSRIATDTGEWQHTHPVSLPEHQRRRRAAVNDTNIPRTDRLLQQPILAAAAAHPDVPAVIGSGGTLSYGELLARAAATAQRLHEAGCRPGERVAILMRKGVEQVIGCLAVLLTGGAYVPIDPAQPVARRDRILDDAGIRQVLTQSWLDTMDLPVRRHLVDTIEADPDSAARWTGHQASTPDKLAYVIYTSGSTGDPKGVMISHQAAANTIDDMNERFGLTSADRVVSIVNLGFDLSVYDLFGVLAAGGAVVLPDADRGADPSHWAELIAEHGVTLWNTVPAQLQMLRDFLDSTDLDLPTLRLALLSGDWIPIDLPERVRARLPKLRLVSLGGATEASIWSIWHPIEQVRPEWRSIPYGTPLSNQTFHVLDSEFQDCPEWTVGELFIGGVGLAEGYLGDERRTAKRFVRHPYTGRRLYRTGDLGRFDPGGWIEFLGREDTQVKVRGHRVELGEIDAAIRRHPAIADAATVLHDEHGLFGYAELALEPAAAPADPAVPVPSTPGGKRKTNWTANCSCG